MSFHTLSDLIELEAEVDASLSDEHAADAYLAEHRYASALGIYRRVASVDPRLVTKIAYCEWKEGEVETARGRLFEISEKLEADGIGLLCHVILSDGDKDRRAKDQEAMWPALCNAVASESVPLIVATARVLNLWPADFEYPQNRRSEIERLLAFHPNSQALRLTVLAELRSTSISVDEQYQLLNAWEYALPIPRYLWESAIVAFETGRYEEAEACLARLEDCVPSSEVLSTNVLVAVAIARCIIAMERNVEDVTEFELLYVGLYLDPVERAMIAHAALVTTLRHKHEKAAYFAQAYFLAVCARAEKNCIDLANLYNPLSVMGGNLDLPGSAWPGDELSDHRDVLTNVSNRLVALYFRALFASSDIDVAYSNKTTPPLAWWDKLLADLRDIPEHAAELGGSFLSLVTAIQVHASRTNWTKSGQAWIESECQMDAADRGLSSYSWLTLQAVAGNKKWTKLFARSAIKQLDKLFSSHPERYDVTEPLADILIRHGLHTEGYLLMRVVCNGDPRADVQCRLGMAAHRVGRASEARSAYAQALKQNPYHLIALINSLRICQSHADEVFLDALAKTIACYPDEQFDRKGRLQGELEEARTRCQDREAAKKAVVEARLLTFPPLVQGDIEPDEIPLRAAVALLALFRCTEAEPGDDLLRPFERCSFPLAPGPSETALMLELLRTGLVAVDPETKLDAFSVRDGVCEGWHLQRIWWRLAPGVGWLVERLRALHGDIPEHWRAEMVSVATEIARGELIEYLDCLARERGWPEPPYNDEVLDLARAMVKELPVAQAFYLCYLGAMSASDYKQRYPVSKQQATNMMVRRAAQRLESVKAGNFAPRARQRPPELPRSAASLALWGTILDMPEKAHQERIEDALASNPLS